MGIEMVIGLAIGVLFIWAGYTIKDFRQRC